MPLCLSRCNLGEQAPPSCFLGPNPPQLEQSQEARLQVLPLAPSPAQVLESPWLGPPLTGPQGVSYPGWVGRGCLSHIGEPVRRHCPGPLKQLVTTHPIQICCRAPHGLSTPPCYYPLSWEQSSQPKCSALFYPILPLPPYVLSSAL